MPRPPLALEVQVANQDGTNVESFREFAPEVTRRGTTDSFTTKLNTGFESASIHLERDERRTYGSPRILQDLTLRGAGAVAWTGRVHNVPPSRADSVQANGWYSVLRDTGAVSEIYIDQDLAKWGPASVQRKAGLAGSWNCGDPSVANDPSTGDASLVQSLVGSWGAGAGQPHWSAYYGGPTTNIGALKYAYKMNTNLAAVPGNFVIEARLCDDAISSNIQSSGNLNGASTGGSTLTNSGGAKHYIELTIRHNGAGGASGVNYDLFWKDLMVFGDHGLGTNIYASEVIKHAIAKYCPTLTATSDTIFATTYPINQLAFEGSTPEEVLLKCNAYHLYELAVWEDRKLWFQPARDLNDYDYELSVFRGDELHPAGPSVDDDEPCNGVWVYFNDVTKGVVDRVGPLGSASPYDTAGSSYLLATDDENPCNREGITRFPKLDISFNCTRADAIQMGSLWLAEKQTKTTIGTGTAVGYVRNRAGAEVPAWQIRAGDRVRYTHENDVIRRVYGTSYDIASARNSLTFERPASTMDGLFERVQTNLFAAGLS